MNITDLLNKYFEGETSCREERELRRFFAKGDLPEELEVYRPLFAFLEQEANRTPTARTKQPRHSRRLRAIYWASTLACGVFLLACLLRRFAPQPYPENFAIIDGKLYADEELAKSKALEAMQNVGLTNMELNELLFHNYKQN